MVDLPDTFEMLVADIWDPARSTYCETSVYNRVVLHAVGSISAKPVHFDRPSEPPITMENAFSLELLEWCPIVWSKYRY